MKKLKLFTLAVLALVGFSGAANAETLLFASDDLVGVSFWLISMGMLAATAFFFMERSSVVAGWKTSVTVAGLITGIAFMNYMYMRAAWVQTGDSTNVYRYIDWLITIPLQMVEFYLILAAVRKVPSGIFWRLLIGSLVMFIGGYLGEVGYIPKLGFVIFMAGWIYLLYEIFSGEAGKAAAKSGNKPFSSAFSALRIIVTVGWAIYPLAYIFSNLIGGVDTGSLNVIYNFADFINKIAFCLIIWAAAMQASSRSR